MEKVDQVFDILNNECTAAKKLEGEILESFMNMFGIGDELGEIYYNEFNLIFFDKPTFDSVRFLVPQHEVIVQVEIPEYHEFIAVIRYFQDNILNEVLS